MEERMPIFSSLTLIEENIRKKLTIDILADSAHFSKYHYQRMFRETVGDSVMAYVNRRRLVLAAEELVKTEDTVLEIALRYGYDSHEGFTRSFKAGMGVTPADYRKYHLVPVSPPMEKEKSVMMYSKTTQEIIRELNGLIVQARETGAYTRKKGNEPETGAFYSKFWDFTADRTETMADKLEKTLEEITAIQHRPDEISARFRMIKAIEDTAFDAGITAFQTGLMIARAKPEHREAFQELCEKYNNLARNARMKAGKAADFLNELAALIFQDMRNTAERKIQEAVTAGRAAAEKLSDPELPYGYLGEAVEEILKKISAVPLEKMTAYMLEEYLIRLDIIVLAADMDKMRAVSQEALFQSLEEFREKISGTAEYFRNLSGEPFQAEEKPFREKNCSDLIFQEKILLFYLKGEIRKLSFSRVDRSSIAALEKLCAGFGQAIALGQENEDGIHEMKKLIKQIYGELVSEAEQMGEYGGPVMYLAEEIIRPVNKK